MDDCSSQTLRITLVYTFLVTVAVIGIALVVYVPAFYPLTAAYHSSTKKIPTSPVVRHAYSESRFRESLSAGKPVVVSVVADWDISTVAHEDFAINRPRVLRMMREKHMTWLRVDLAGLSAEDMQEWTGYFPGVTSLGMLLFRPGLREPIVVSRDRITEDVVLQVLAGVR